MNELQSSSLARISQRKSSLRKIKTLVLGAAGASLGLIAPSAEAFVDNTYPAIQCVYHSGGVPTPTLGMLENRTNVASVVNCPIELKEASNIDAASVVVWNANGADVVTCTLRKIELSATFVGGYQIAQEEVQSSVLLNDWNPLNFSAITVNPLYTTHAFFRCVIPAAVAGAYSKIGSYKTNDFVLY